MHSIRTSSIPRLLLLFIILLPLTCYSIQDTLPLSYYYIITVHSTIPYHTIQSFLPTYLPSYLLPIHPPTHCPPSVLKWSGNGEEGESEGYPVNRSPCSCRHHRIPDPHSMADIITNLILPGIDGDTKDLGKRHKCSHLDIRFENDSILYSVHLVKEEGK